MTYLKLAAVGILLVLSIASPVAAQVTLDISKITCKQFRGYEITNPNNIAIWLSGYYHGKNGSTILRVDEFKNAAKKVSDYCIMHPDMTVMQAVSEVFEPNGQ